MRERKEEWALIRAPRRLVGNQWTCRRVVGWIGHKAKCGKEWEIQHETGKSEKGPGRGRALS
jgi:hypothetical protein